MRCITRKSATEIKCKCKGACRIETGEATSGKKHCAACRFKKCIQLGMIKNGT